MIDARGLMKSHNETQQSFRADLGFVGFRVALPNLPLYKQGAIAKFRPNWGLTRTTKRSRRDPTQPVHLP